MLTRGDLHGAGPPTLPKRARTVNDVQKELVLCLSNAAKDVDPRKGVNHCAGFREGRE